MHGAKDYGKVVETFADGDGQHFGELGRRASLRGSFAYLIHIRCVRCVHL